MFSVIDTEFWPKILLTSHYRLAEPGPHPDPPALTVIYLSVHAKFSSLSYKYFHGHAGLNFCFVLRLFIPVNNFSVML